MYISTRTRVINLSAHCPTQFKIEQRTYLEVGILQIRIVVECPALAVNHVLCTCCIACSSSTIATPQQSPRTQDTEYLNRDAS